MGTLIFSNPKLSFRIIKKFEFTIFGFNINMPYLYSDEEILKMCGMDGYGVPINKIRSVVPTAKITTPFTNIRNYENPSNIPPPESKINFAMQLHNITGTSEQEILQILASENPPSYASLFPAETPASAPMPDQFGVFEARAPRFDPRFSVLEAEVPRPFESPAEAPADSPTDSPAEAPASSDEFTRVYEAVAPPPPTYQQALSMEDPRFTSSRRRAPTLQQLYQEEEGDEEEDASFDEFSRFTQQREANLLNTEMLSEDLSSGAMQSALQNIQDLNLGVSEEKQAEEVLPPQMVLSRSGRKISADRQRNAQEGQFRRRERAGMTSEDIASRYNGFFVRNERNTPGQLRHSQILNNYRGIVNRLISDPDRLPPEAPQEQQQPVNQAEFQNMAQQMINLFPGT